MRSIIMAVLFCLFQMHLLGQKIVPVRDSIMNTYMKNGYANEHFRPAGDFDSKKRRQGKWKDYEVKEDGFYQVIDDMPMREISMYLLDGEGEFSENFRTGVWNIYVIEDKSFRKLLCKTVTYLNGKENGTVHYFYPDGRLAQIGNYVNGKIEDSVTIFYNDQKIFGLQFYKHDNKEGEQRYFYHSGPLKYIFTYRNGLREGMYEAYYENGHLREKFMYKADSIDGVYDYYYDNGNLWTEKIYKNGLLLNVSTVLTKSGEPLDKGTLIDGNGYVNYYTEDGKIYSKVIYKGGREVNE